MTRGSRQDVARPIDAAGETLAEGYDPELLTSRFRRGLGLSFVNSVLTRLATFSLGILLARLLAPDEFGLYAVALVVLNLISVFSDLGGGAAVVRHTGDIRPMLPTVWSVSLIGSVLTYLVCYFAAPLLADGFGESGATALIRVLSLNVILSGIAIVPAAVLTRNLQQGKRLIADLVGVAASLSLTGILALAGYGAWSLVVGNCIGTAVVVALLVALSHEFPHVGIDRLYLREVARIGGAAMAGALLLTVLVSVPQIVTGSMLGATALGFFYLASNVAHWPVQIATATLQRVILAMFSRQRDAGERMDVAAGSVLARLLAVCLPAAAALAILADPVIVILYGDRWKPAAIVLSALAIAAMVRILSEVVLDLLLALGAPGLTVAVNLIWLVGLIPVTIVAGHVWGLAGIAWAQAGVAIVVSLPANAYALHRAGIRPLPLLGRITPGLIGLPLAVAAQLILSVTMQNSWLVLLAGAAVTALAVLLGLLLVSRRPHEAQGASPPADSVHPARS